MDAKPQRPVRALHVRDENAPHQLPAGKSIHTRNKSTPVLSTLMQAGALRAGAPKRAAFADVSNTTRLPVVKDDGQVPSKGNQIELLKDPAIVSAKELNRPTVLVRPAQRPLGNASIKTSATNGATHAQTTLPKQLTIDANGPTANTRKILSKKATTVFRETNETAQNDHRLPVVTEPTRKASVQDTLTRYVVQSPAKIETRVVDEHVSVETKYSTVVPEAHKTNEYLDALEEQARVIEQERNDELAKAHMQRPEPEEYWDEDAEDGDEYFDADGYETARSIRSRGDNTTGGVTLMLAPRVTTKSQRELDVAKQWVDANKTIEDIEDEQWDTSMVAEYGEEIFTYMRELEERMQPNATYMDHQSEIQWSMRSVLMDWLVQVHNRFTLLPETLFLAVNYVDRFLSAKVVSLGKLQLVGATALFLAAKYEEINCPSVQEIVYMVDGAYTVDEVLKAERFMLSMLHFELGWPGPMSFLRRISKADDYDLETRTLAKYFLEITVMDERFVGCSPSFLSAAAHCLARLMLKKGDWSMAHVHYSGYTMQQLRSVVITILECCENPQKHHAAVYEKYTDKRYKRASVFVSNELSKGFKLSFGSQDSIAGQGLTWKRK